MSCIARQLLYTLASFKSPRYLLLKVVLYIELGIVSFPPFLMEGGFAIRT